MALTAGICKTATEEPALLANVKTLDLGDNGQGVDILSFYIRCIFKKFIYGPLIGAFKYLLF